MDHCPRRAVVTGGPGAGKSTLLGELARREIVVEPEVARAILREPQRDDNASGGTAQVCACDA